MFVNDFGAEDIGGHQVRCELDAFEIDSQHPRDGLHQQGLGQSRHTNEQAVAIGKQGSDQTADDFLLADDGFGKLVHDRARRPGYGVDIIDFRTHAEVNSKIRDFPGSNTCA